MWLRVFLAGVAGGILIFLAGFVAHTQLGWQSRTIHNIANSQMFLDQIKDHSLAPGFYMFPDMLPEADRSDPAKLAEATDRLKSGPAGMLLVWRPGADPMPEMIGKELATNIIAALLAAWVVSLAGADVGFARRWLAVFAIGLITWFSLSTSYGIWYRFPHEFVHDEVLCAMLEWGVAGLAIAAIVRRPAIPLAQSSASPGN